MSEFKREVRYTVIKHNQLTESQMQYLKNCIFGEGIPTVEAVVVESDWPEYRPVWKMIEDRVSGAPVEGGKAEYDALAKAMTTNQMIDGVSRAAIEWLLEHNPALCRKAGLDTPELRALLDSPAKSMALVPYDLLNTACNGFVQEQGHAINELRELLSNLKADLYVESPSTVLDSADGADNFVRDSNSGGEPAIAQPQGEPVACMPVERCYDVRVKMIIAFNESKKAGGDLDDALDAAYKSALRYSPNPMSAEQPAPVAVVRMCDCNQGRLPCHGQCKRPPIA